MKTIEPEGEYTADEWKNKVIETKTHKLGFIIHVKPLHPQKNRKETIEFAHTTDGVYIGNVKTAKMLYKKGIKPQPINRKSNICSIGFNEKEQKWYGWSHRAMYGFGIGDIVKKGDCTAVPGESKSLPVGFKAETLDGAKRMAIAFADSVA